MHRVAVVGTICHGEDYPAAATHFNEEFDGLGLPEKGSVGGAEFQRSGVEIRAGSGNGRQATGGRWNRQARPNKSNESGYNKASPEDGSFHGLGELAWLARLA